MQLEGNVLLAWFICGKRTITHAIHLFSSRGQSSWSSSKCQQCHTAPHTCVHATGELPICQSGRYQLDVIADVSILALILCSKNDFMIKKIPVEFRPRIIFRLDYRFISMFKNVFTAILKSIIELTKWQHMECLCYCILCFLFRICLKLVCLSKISIKYTYILSIFCLE